MARLEELIFFLGLFFSFLLPPMDPDLGWQLWKNFGWQEVYRDKISVVYKRNYEKRDI